MKRRKKKIFLLRYIIILLFLILILIIINKSETIYLIKDKFENSILPIKVDVVDLDNISSEFRIAIADNMTELNFKD